MGEGRNREIGRGMARVSASGVGKDRRDGQMARRMNENLYLTGLGEGRISRKSQRPGIGQAPKNQ